MVGLLVCLSFVLISRITCNHQRHTCFFQSQLSTYHNMPLLLFWTMQNPSLLALWCGISHEHNHMIFFLMINANANDICIWTQTCIVDRSASAYIFFLMRQAMISGGMELIETRCWWHFSFHTMHWKLESLFSYSPIQHLTMLLFWRFHLIFNYNSIPCDNWCQFEHSLLWWTLIMLELKLLWSAPDFLRPACGQPHECLILILMMWFVMYTFYASHICNWKYIACSYLISSITGPKRHTHTHIASYYYVNYVN